MLKVYWAIWASIACAVHSGAVWLIFSKRLLTWKQSDWICLSHVGKASRAKTKRVYKISNNRIFMLVTFILINAVYYIWQALANILDKLEHEIYSTSTVSRLPPSGWRLKSLAGVIAQMCSVPQQNVRSVLRQLFIKSPRSLENRLFQTFIISKRTFSQVVYLYFML